MNEQEERQQLALNAVADLIHEVEPGSMVTRFVLIAEVVDPANERACWLLVPPDSRPWDVAGLCHFAISATALEINQQED